MDDICAYCRHFDQDDTELPVCELHRKLTEQEWTCGDFWRRDGEKG